MAKRGTYIVIEGIDGSGKSTQAHMLVDKFLSEGRLVRATREPGSNLVQNLPFDAYGAVQEQSLNRLTVEFLLHAERVEHLLRVGELLQAGISVISDRSAVSGYCYAMSNQLPQALVFELQELQFKICRPDLLLWLDVPVEEALYRLKKRGGPLASEEKEANLKRVRQYFELFFLRRHPFNTAHIDAEAKNSEEVRVLIERVVDNFFADEVLSEDLKAAIFLQDDIVSF